jgi:hypothetical protein
VPRGFFTVTVGADNVGGQTLLRATSVCASTEFHCQRVSVGKIGHVVAQHHFVVSTVCWRTSSARLPADRVRAWPVLAMGRERNDHDY